MITQFKKRRKKKRKREREKKTSENAWDIGLRPRRSALVTRPKTLSNGGCRGWTVLNQRVLRSMDQQRSPTLEEEPLVACGWDPNLQMQAFPRTPPPGLVHPKESRASGQKAPCKVPWPPRLSAPGVPAAARVSQDFGPVPKLPWASLFGSDLGIFWGGGGVGRGRGKNVKRHEPWHRLPTQTLERSSL